jgi:hypothetical protein
VWCGDYLEQARATGLYMGKNTKQTVENKGKIATSHEFQNIVIISELIYTVYSNIYGIRDSSRINIDI